MSQDTTMLHVYGWRRDGGPSFFDNPRTLEDGIAFAETVLKDCRRGLGNVFSVVRQMAISLYFLIAVAAAIAFVTAKSVWGRILVFAGVLTLFLVGVVLWNVFVNRRGS